MISVAVQNVARPAKIDYVSTKMVIFVFALS